MRARAAMSMILIFCFSALPAYGYIDPGTGSMVLQLILGGVAGALVAGKLFWTRISAFLGFRRSRKDSSK